MNDQATQTPSTGDQRPSLFSPKNLVLSVAVFGVSNLGGLEDLVRFEHG